MRPLKVISFADPRAISVFCSLNPIRLEYAPSLQASSQPGVASIGVGEEGQVVFPVS